VFNVLLQVLDDGRLTDGQGRTVDFKNTVIVMTSNIGSQLILAEGSPAGDENAAAVYERIKGLVWQEVKQQFRPEFLNRIDEVVVFHALDQANIASIARVQLESVKARLAKLEIGLEISEAALNRLALVGFDPLFGARPLKRAIQQQIENPLARMILEGKFGPKSVIRVGDAMDHFTFDGVLEGGVQNEHEEAAAVS
jgi:ATP-dependent Clp protease ATP-binding subunit ClpB